MARGSGNGNGKGRARKGRPARAQKAEATWRLEKKRDPSYFPDTGGNCVHSGLPPVPSEIYNLCWVSFFCFFVRSPFWESPSTGWPAKPHMRK